MAACHSAAPIGHEIRVRDHKIDPCRRYQILVTRLYFGRIRYRIENTPSGIRVSQALRFNVDDAITNARLNEIFPAIQQSAKDISDVWSRYGITLDLQVDTNRAPSLSQVDLEMNLKDEDCRTNEGTLCYRMGKGAALWDQSTVTRMLIHELGHFLSLDDEYSEGWSCHRHSPAFPGSEDYMSIMDDTWDDWSRLEFFPGDIRKVLKPLCGDLP